MTAKDFGIAVNVFWKNLKPEFYDPNDPYGNKDLLPAARGLKMLSNVIGQLKALPDDYKDFYARQLINKLESQCLLRPL
jgi:tRNA wybutosine-synthesizing protein 5